MSTIQKTGDSKKCIKSKNHEGYFIKKVLYSEKCIESDFHEGYYIKTISDHTTNWKTVYYKACKFCHASTGIDKTYCTPKEYEDQPIENYRL